jgi:hypothetical protein
VASSIIDPVAEALKDIVDGAVTGLTGIKWGRLEASPPVGIVGLPTGSRVGVDEAESQLGSDDWNLSYPVALFFDLAEAAASQAQAVEAVEAVIAAIDDNPTLSATVFDAKVTNFEPEAITDRNRPLLAYTLDVDVLKLVAS